MTLCIKYAFMASFSKAFVPSHHTLLINPPLLPLVYFQRHLWCKHLRSPGFWSWRNWRLPHLQRCGQAANHFVAPGRGVGGRTYWLRVTLGRILTAKPHTTPVPPCDSHQPFTSHLPSPSRDALGNDRATSIPGRAPPQGIRLKEPVLLEVSTPNPHTTPGVSGVLCVISLAECNWKWGLGGKYLHQEGTC